ncbi:hypothetical protein GCM10023340_43710 [Nocardioides marinquilinus]|uniref:EfeO-type cupredoxin-like domain-containing protein n=1 Tax=Nocardioides marinquilinus TaxID=1210400 RepID=A0ABP9Q356_9ACTN
MRIKRSVLPGLALSLVLVAGACAGPDEDDDTGATGTDPTSASTPSDAPTDEASEPSASGAPSEATSPAEVTSEPAEEPSESEAPAGPTLDITIEGDDISPNAEELELGTGEPLTLVITSDRAGELHVHSKPEQYVEFDAGTSEHELVVETPGEVEVEEHDSDAVVALIEVS